MFSLNCNGRLLTIDGPVVMGILNVNEQSFYSNSRYTTEKQILQAAEKMLTEGAAILDIGAHSTQPGSKRISIEEEVSRAIPAVKMIHKQFPEAYISIDTFNSTVAKEAVGVGASIVNDISAGSMDLNFIKSVAQLNVPYVLTHMKGEPDTMQVNPQYQNVVREVMDFFIAKLNHIKTCGIKDIVVDIGFGFGKNAQHNFALLKNLSLFKMLNCPLLLGVSRKGTIYKTLETTADKALNGTTVLNTIGLLNGANILRVHDAKEAMEAIKLVTAYSS